MTLLYWISNLLFYKKDNDSKQNKTFIRFVHDCLRKYVAYQLRLYFLKFADPTLNLRSQSLDNTVTSDAHVSDVM